ncbi:MAG: AAA family ATPase [Solirubrobacterales bacterium]|nr:AAA family ATPase [Solirubrobacterales bacterium]
MPPSGSISATNARDQQTKAARISAGHISRLRTDERAEALDTQLPSETMGVYKLSDALESVRGRYDRILMECPPNIGELTVSALLAADDIVCPVNMGDINAVRGLSRLTRRSRNSTSGTPRSASRAW